jgi:hypothetical protein
MGQVLDLLLGDGGALSIRRDDHTLVTLDYDGLSTARLTDRTTMLIYEVRTGSGCATG